MAYSAKNLGGLLLLVGSLQWVLAMIVAEARYAGYSVANNFISDLGVDHGSALIFNGSTLLSGVLFIIAAYLIRNEFGSRFFTISLALAGVGPLGVGVFNESHLLIHSLFALIAFIFGAVAPITAGVKFLKPPLSYIFVVMGAFSLFALILFLIGFRLGIGVGGIERMIVYPNTLWIVVFGGYLMADTLSFAVSKN